jgi:hypothetical protein
MSSSSPRRMQPAVRLCAERSWNEPSGKDASSLTPEEGEEAAQLLKAARADLRAANVLATDPEQADEVVGFHVQQAVEKAIKTVLVASGIGIPYNTI